MHGHSRWSGRGTSYGRANICPPFPPGPPPPGPRGGPPSGRRPAVTLSGRPAVARSPRPAIVRLCLKHLVPFHDLLHFFPTALAQHRRHQGQSGRALGIIHLLQADASARDEPGRQIGPARPLLVIVELVEHGGPEPKRGRLMWGDLKMPELRRDTRSTGIGDDETNRPQVTPPASPPRAAWSARQRRWPCHGVVIATVGTSGR
jgi:hypothetical protein